MAELTCRNLTLGYEGSVLFENLTFEVNQGDYLCIVGENGSGKSTLMRTILHLQPPMSGTITLGDGLKPTEIGYLPQQTVVQRDFPASVQEIVLSGCQGAAGRRPFYTKAEKQTAAENMARLGISDLARRCYRELSGGQQQRVLLARALCATDSLLLLDEPVTGLDPVTTEDYYGLIRRLNREHGVSIVMVSHDLRGSMADATKVLEVDKGVHFCGTIEEYRKKAGKM